MLHDVSGVENRAEGAGQPARPSPWRRWRQRWEAYRDYWHAGNLTPTRLRNVAVYLSHRSQSGVLPYYPLYYMVETGNVCRLRCPFCVQGHYDARVHSTRSVLVYDDFLRILDKIAPYALVLDLFKHGEPFLNPHIVWMIRAATARRIRCRINSGMNFPLDRERARDICRSGLYKIVCAIDGVTQDVYEKYRVNGNLELALRNAAALLDARRELGLRRPVMVFRMLVFEWNHHQVERARALASDMGFDRFAADPGVFYLNGRTVEWDIPSQRWRETAWHLDSIFPDSTSERSRTGPGRCASLFNTLVLHTNGASMVCCHSSRKQWEHDSLLDKTLGEVWNSESYQATRRAALGLEPPSAAAFPQCRTCCWL